MAINFGQHNTESNEEHGIEKPQPHPAPKIDAERPGYEVSDVNAKGVVVFLAGLVGFLVVFFVFCYAAGKAINFGLLKQDGDAASTNPQAAAAGQPAPGLHRGESMSTSTEMEQRESSLITQSFPTPRLDADDSNQSTADLHAREDLLLDHYTLIEPGQGSAGNSGPVGNVRIPIEVAMQLLVKRGLPASNGTTGTPNLLQAKMSGDVDHLATVPLTNGFARTAWELEQMESRGQQIKLEHEGEKQSSEQHAKLEKK